MAVFATMLIGEAKAKDSDCWEKTGDVQIKACTRTIKSKRLVGKRVSKKNLAIMHNFRGNAYDDKGQVDRAIADYNKAIQLNPKSALAYNQRGRAYELVGQREKAIADYRKALEINPSYSEAESNLVNLGVDP